MEVIEIISHFINRDNNMLSVEFRLNTDLPSEVRSDVIEYEHIVDFGFDSIEQDVLDIEYEDDEDEDIWLDDMNDEYMDEDTLIQFLNEYYVVFPEKLPEAESE
jgi:hypothetical protein